MSSNPFYDDGMEPLPRSWWTEITNGPTRYRDRGQEQVQAAVLAAQANRARLQAEKQAAMGVAPAVAARQAANYVSWSALFWIFVGVPSFFIAVGVWTLNPLIMLWKIFMLGLAFVILLRLEHWRTARADRRYVYRLPTWSLLLIGLGGWVLAPFLYILGEVLMGHPLPS